jgi:phospholipase C
MLTHETIGDRLSAKGVEWAWYAGGWSNADGRVNAPGWTNGLGPTCADPNANPAATFPNCPDGLFQFHHQAFNYFANFAPGTAARADHLLDEAEFVAAAKSGRLKQVSFVKPIGAENEHPGYASETNADQTLVKLIDTILTGPNGHDTLIIITYDEFGGQWDHVPPPPYNYDRYAAADVWGPGTRIPAILISKRLPHSGVDHTAHDTTSIIKLIEERFHIAPLSSRDGKVQSLRSALDAAD